MQTEVFYTEAELADASGRSREYLKRARKAGLISPAGKTEAAGIHLYRPADAAAVRSINVPVFGSGNRDAATGQVVAVAP